MSNFFEDLQSPHILNQEVQVEVVISNFQIQLLGVDLRILENLKPWTHGLRLFLNIILLTVYLITNDSMS